MTVTSITNPTLNSLVDSFPSLILLDKNLIRNFKDVYEILHTVSGKVRNPEDLVRITNYVKNVAYQVTLCNLESTTRISLDVESAILQMMDLISIAIMFNYDLTDFRDSVSNNPCVDMIIPEQLYPNANFVFFGGKNSGRLIAFAMDTTLQKNKKILISVFERDTNPVDFETLQAELFEDLMEGSHSPNSRSRMFRVII